jgi:hypothetical protein
MTTLSCEQVLTKALQEIDDTANGRDQLDAYPRSAAERLRRLAEISTLAQEALRAAGVPRKAGTILKAKP